MSGGAQGLGWALIKPSITSEEYIPVEVSRVGKRFTFVRTLSGSEWRYTTRSLWTVPTYEAAQAEIEKMRAYRRAAFARARDGDA